MSHPATYSTCDTSTQALLHTHTYADMHTLKSPNRKQTFMIKIDTHGNTAAEK